jgi:hypothetical protein
MSMPHRRRSYMIEGGTISHFLTELRWKPPEEQMGPPMPMSIRTSTSSEDTILFRIPHMPQAGSLKVLCAQARWVGI